MGNCHPPDKKDYKESLLDKIVKAFQPPDGKQELLTSTGPPMPRHMLWGCNTPEEHYECIREACDKVARLEGLEGLRMLGFEYRMVHHKDGCVCEGCLTDSDDDDRGRALEDEFDESDDDDESGDQFEELEWEQKSDYNVQDEPHDHRVGESFFKRETSFEHESFMIPVGISIDDHILGDSKKELSRVDSSDSLFSLSTHFTTGSDLSSGANEPSRNAQMGDKQEDDKFCALRLFHIPSGSTLVTTENHESFIAHGKMYDEVARLCMEYAQAIMMEEGNLQWATVCNERGIHALVSRGNAKPPAKQQNDEAEKKKEVLLCVTGKGKVRAGIFSRRHIITTGLEPATALPFVREAVRRDMDIVILDPNAKEHLLGMDVVEESLKRIFFDQDKEEEEIYVLAHSMAGAHLVRFLHNKPTSSKQPPSNLEHNSNNNDKKCENINGEANAMLSFQRKIRAVAFTDSNHNINWTKGNPTLSAFLEGPSCLYIKSHKVHEDAKALGEAHHDCQYWRHRFGDIKTLWAGTNEHALTNHTARFHIWDHFDSFLRPGTSS